MTESKTQEAEEYHCSTYTGVELGVPTSTSVNRMNQPMRLNKQTNEYTCGSIKQVNTGNTPENHL
jgi:hypothetical protein